MKIINTIVKVSSNFIEYMVTKYIDTNGNEKIWEWVRRVGERKAVMIVAKYEDKLVITKEYRVPLGDYEWNFPAGLIDNNETIDMAVERELKEETGLDVYAIIHTSPFVYNSAGLTNESIAIVYCEAIGATSIDNTEASEDIEVFLMDYEQIKQLINDPTKKIGAKAYLLMERYITFGRI